MPSSNKDNLHQLTTISPEDLKLNKTEVSWFTKEQIAAYEELVKNFGILDEPKRFSSRGLLMLRANSESWKTSEFVKFLHEKLEIKTADDEKKHSRWFNPTYQRSGSNHAAETPSSDESVLTQSETLKEETPMTDITMTELQTSMNALKASIDKCDVKKLSELDVDAINAFVKNANVSQEVVVVERPLLRKITKIGLYTLGAGAVVGAGYAGWRYWQNRNGDAQTADA